MQIKKIVVPVDGSDHSHRATEYAVELAGLTGARILLIHCHRPFPALLGEPYFQKAVSTILTHSDELLDPYRQILKSSTVEFEDRILEGPPGHAICEVAQIEKSDMIIMGSRGHTNLEGLFLGSVTHRVLHAAPCPVLVIR
jgi:nucleotide-binding universal stress UspA family protein